MPEIPDALIGYLVKRGAERDLRDMLARTIRDRVRLTLGPDASRTLAEGRPVILSGREADDAADAALAALAEHGLVVVGRADLDAYVNRGKDLPREVTVLRSERSPMPKPPIIITPPGRGSRWRATLLAGSSIDYAAIESASRDTVLKVAGILASHLDYEILEGGHGE